MPVLDADTGLPTGRLIQQRIPVQTVAPKTEYKLWKNARTGETQRLPAGIDPGFDYNLGKQYRIARQMRFLGEKLAVATQPIAQAVVQTWVSGPALDYWLAKPVEAVPIAVVTDDQAAAVKAKTRVVMLSSGTVLKQRKSHPELGDEEYKLIAKAVVDGREIQDTGRSLAFIYEGERGYVTVIKATRSGLGLFLISFRRLSTDLAKRDAEILRLEKRRIGSG